MQDSFVDIAKVVPGIIVDLRYATKNNFVGEVIYPFKAAYMRHETAQKLAKVQKMLMQDGYQLVIWDAFRPVSAQFVLWAHVPDPIFVADPTKGYSNHSRGNTVDVSLADSDGTLLEMPTAFDAITPLANRSYEGITKTAKQNALLLENAMYQNGFNGYFHEWWHYEDTQNYSVGHIFIPE